MNTKNCIKCHYHKKGKCLIDKHKIEIDLLRAYSCKYYKIINKGGDNMNKQELARETFRQLVHMVQKSSKKRNARRRKRMK